MLKFVLIDSPKSLPKCKKCGGKVGWFGAFSVHDMMSDKAHGYCKDCSHFCVEEKETVYGKIVEMSLTEIKKLFGKK